jgi:hypothetical protein
MRKHEFQKLQDAVEVINTYLEDDDNPIIKDIHLLNRFREANDSLTALLFSIQNKRVLKPFWHPDLANDLEDKGGLFEIEKKITVQIYEPVDDREYTLSLCQPIVVSDPGRYRNVEKDYRYGNDDGKAVEEIYDDLRDMLFLGYTMEVVH